MLLARQPRAMSGTQDITGGLPRVTEIVEARKPKEPAVLAEISGLVEIRADKRRGKMTIIIRNEKSGMEKEHHVPQDRQLLVHANDRVEAGDPLIEGPLIPQDILRIRGEETLQQYLLDEVQAVYRAQNVTINDKHLEIIINQMLRKVKIEDPGHSSFLPGEVVDKFAFRRENDRLSKSVRITSPGDTELSEGDVVLKSELAAASFQETTKVLTEAALSGATDRLIGLKENVILGHLIPAGTGFKPYVTFQVDKLGEPLPLIEETPAETFAAANEALNAMALEAEQGEESPLAVSVGAGQAEAEGGETLVEDVGAPEVETSDDQPKLEDSTPSEADDTDPVV
jgi:DNA-directed RNA polymerase subunit beta'